MLKISEINENKINCDLKLKYSYPPLGISDFSVQNVFYREKNVLSIGFAANPVASM